MKLRPNDAPPDADAVDTRNSTLAHLFEAHNRELLSFLMTRLGEAEARDVAQEAYARLLRLDQPETLSFLRAYLFKTAANLSIDRLRHRQTLKASQTQIELLQALRTQPDPEELTAREQEAGRAAEYLLELPEPCRRAFLLYRVYEYSLAEVAAEMGVSERMIRYYIAQAMDHCRVRLQRNT